MAARKHAALVHPRVRSSPAEWQVLEVHGRAEDHTIGGASGVLRWPGRLDLLVAGRCSVGGGTVALGLRLGFGFGFGLLLVHE